MARIYFVVILGPNRSKSWARASSLIAACLPERVPQRARNPGSGHTPPWKAAVSHKSQRRRDTCSLAQIAFPLPIQALRLANDGHPPVFRARGAFGKSHWLRNEIIVRSQKAQEETSSCPRALFFMLSPGCKTVLRAKLAHIVLKEGQGFNA